MNDINISEIFANLRELEKRVQVLEDEKLEPNSTDQSQSILEIPKNLLGNLTSADFDPEAVAVLFAALGNSDRLRIVRDLSLHPKAGQAHLKDVIGTDSSGQLYHHLNILKAAGVIETVKRGVYKLSGENSETLFGILDLALKIQPPKGGMKR